MDLNLSVKLTLLNSKFSSVYELSLKVQNQAIKPAEDKYGRFLNFKPQTLFCRFDTSQLLQYAAVL